MLGRERLLSKERVSAEWVPLVIRLINGDLEESQEQVAALPIYWTSSLKQAIADTLSLAETIP